MLPYFLASLQKVKCTVSFVCLPPACLSVDGGSQPSFGAVSAPILSCSAVKKALAQAPCHEGWTVRPGPYQESLK